MKRATTRLVALLLVLVMAMTMLPITALADLGGGEGGDSKQDIVSVQK